MKVLVRFAVLSLIVFSLSLVGCLGGGDDDNSLTSTGEIWLSATIDAGDATFSSSLRSAVSGDIRADVSDTFTARVTIGNNIQNPLALELYNKGLNLLQQKYNAPVGEIKIKIEVLNIAQEPILETIIFAGVDVHAPSIQTNLPVNFGTTAKAVAYESWLANDPARANTTYDDFKPTDLFLDDLAKKIKTTLIVGGKIDGTKNLSEKLIVDTADLIEDAVVATSPSVSEITGVWKATITDPESQNSDVWDIHFLVTDNNGKAEVEFLDYGNWASNVSYENGMLSFARTMNSGKPLVYKQTWSIFVTSPSVMKFGKLEQGSDIGSWIAAKTSFKTIPTTAELSKTWRLRTSRSIDGVVKLYQDSADLGTNYIFYDDEKMLGFGYKSEPGQNGEIWTSDVEWKISYTWTITGNKLNLFDQDGVGTHKEVWQITMHPDEAGLPNGMRLKLVSDSDNADRTGEIMNLYAAN